MKLADVKSNINIGASKEINDKNLNFKIGNHVRISKYNFFFLQKVSLQVGLKTFLWLKELKLLCHGHIYSGNSY